MAEQAVEAPLTASTKPPLRRSRATAKAGASQYQLLWRRFTTHKAGVAGALVIALTLAAVLLTEFVAPHDPARRHFEFANLPPQGMHFFSSEGFHLRPFVYGVKATRDPQTSLIVYSENSGQRHPLRFFVRGDRYSFYGLFESDLHLFGTDAGAPFFPLGTDRFGRDQLSRLLAGGRVSLSVGLLAVGLSILFGTTLGLISGFYGGRVDALMQRLIELIAAFPAIPILMALSALIPAQWPPKLTFAGIVVVLSLIGWGGLAREIRGKTLSIRESDFVLAARASGARNARILFRHILPSMWSHILVISTLALPRFMLSESTLSFLGLGIKPPDTSWGLLLNSATNLHVLHLYPWLLAPGACIFITALAFNFMGDALRDAAAPFNRA